MNNSRIVLRLTVTLLALAVIFTIVHLYNREIPKPDLKQLDPFEFRTYVEKLINENVVPSQNKNEAQRAYNRIYEIIEVEASISVRDTSGLHPLIENLDAEDLFVNLFEAYFFPFYMPDANSLFGQSSWPSNRLNEIREEAIKLQEKHGTESGADSLRNYIGYVDGFENGKDLLNNRSNICKNRSDYDSLWKEAAEYEEYPYYNLALFKDIKSTVRDKAKRKWYSNVNDYVYGVNANATRNKKVFYNMKRTANSKIDEYYRCFKEKNLYNKWKEHLDTQDSIFKSMPRFK